jgi:hypothetical protein
MKWTLLLGSIFVSVDGGNIGNRFSPANIMGKSLTKNEESKDHWLVWLRFVER